MRRYLNILLLIGAASLGLTGCMRGKFVATEGHPIS